ncbi:GntR family transcriptional regulator [Falsirhodobacter algicola]|uniref:FCD domain-containing protein n=1 Tax=Falsirhodobacter algicola TaxID=2692330 RepID=A0A8J8SLV1_9RHOB|nr:GntR family transcriptional regulator [Falsirhodobacter algicola]QUS36761.1 FCD domain-containing protein [Falsirhodobacter algicola]
MAQTAASELRQRILNAVYPPGFQLKQDVLAAELGMSRIPLREAFLILEKEGLIRLLPHRGAIVAQLSPEEIDELFSMRMLMEPWLLERSAPRLTSADFARLHRIQTRYFKALNDHDVSMWNAINREFHMTLYQHAASHRMLALSDQLLAEVEIHTRTQLLHIPADRERAVAEHAELLDACENGRFAEAADLLRAHIEHIRKALLDLLSSSP